MGVVLFRFMSIYRYCFNVLFFDLHSNYHFY